MKTALTAIRNSLLNKLLNDGTMSTESHNLLIYYVHQKKM